MKKKVPQRAVIVIALPEYMIVSLSRAVSVAVVWIRLG